MKGDVFWSKYQRSSFRDDIQGLRAISALLILVYHIWFNKVSGGVDVFFVVSGYMMASVLLRQYAKHQRLFLWQFWGRICQRVLPSAFVVLIATLLLAMWLMPAVLQLELVKEILAASLQLENILLIQNSTDYLARELPPSPVQHFWALSIQMQFFWFLPFTLLAIITLSGKGRKPWLLAALLGLLWCASLGYGVWRTSVEPTAAYFDPLARYWQFLTGVAVALVLPWLFWRPATSRVLATFGLLGVLVTGLIVPAHANFPGLVALIPVMSASMLLLAGAGQSTGRYHGTSRWLANPYMSRLGAWSFTLYLWHWPILVMAQHHLGTTKLTIPQGLAVIVLSLSFAWATRALVEKPMAMIRFKRTAHTHFAAVCMFCLVFGANFVWWINLEESRNTAMAELISTPYQYPVTLPLNVTSANEYLDDTMQLAMAKLQPKPHRDGCHQGRRHSEVKVCQYGNIESPVTVALVGGSHSLQWFSALEVVAKQQGWRLLNMTKTACPLGAQPGNHPSCQEWNEAVIDTLHDLAPDLVITASTRADGLELSLDEAEYVPASYIEQWTRIVDAHINVVGIRDNPYFSSDVPICVGVQQHDLSRCHQPRHLSLANESPAEAYTHLIQEIDFSEYLCTERECVVMVDGTPVYRDRHHLNVTFVERLAPALKRKLNHINPELFML